MTRVVVTGATGAIGQVVCRALLARGDQVVALTRDLGHARATLGMEVEVRAWPAPTQEPAPAGALAGAGAVIHLLGEPVAQRWSAAARARIRDSRVLGTRMLVTALRELSEQQRPRALVSQSATGYYGHCDDRELDEDAPAGDDFLAQIVAGWEAEARAAQELVRLAITRTGVVLSPGAGALARMLPAFRAGIGGPVAGGRQYVPWIHLDDLVAALLFCLDREDARGPLNLTAPNPVNNATLSRSLGAALHRPAVLPLPGLALRLLYGQMAEIVTSGQRALPRRLLALGFEFRQPQIGPALRDVLAR